MTITTPNLARAVAQAWARPLGASLTLAALLLAPSARADWRFTPTLELRETYTDNVALQPDALARSQFVTEITPGFRLRHNGPRLVMNADYQLKYFVMADSDVSGTNRSARRLQANGRASLVDDLMYVDANASSSQQSVSPFGQQSSYNEYASANRATVNTWRVSPYLVHRFGATADSELRYTRDSVSAGASGLGNTDGDTVSFKLNSGSAFHTLGWSLLASQQHISDSLGADGTIKNANLGLRYRVAPRLSLTGGVGYDSYDYQSISGANGGKAWNVGFAWNYSARTTVSASNGRRFFGPSRTLRALHRSRHTAWSINYDDTVSSTRANFLLPAAIDTAALLDDLFRATYPDPVERQRAVDEYIRITGLPPALADTVNYFSNRYMLQKSLRASTAYRQGRTSAMLAVFRVRRDALSVRETDSPILGNNLNTINDNTIQKGVSATLDYRLTGRTSLYLTGDVTDSESLTTAATARASSVRFSARHQLRANMRGTLELRHIKGNTGLVTGHPYTENAVAASISMQL